MRRATCCLAITVLALSGAFPRPASAQTYNPKSIRFVSTEPSQHLDPAELLRITGLQQGVPLTKDDILEGRQFPDAIGQGIYPVDVHHPKGLGSTIIKPKQPYKIPYRILTPRAVQNCLVAGRCVSATHEALGAVRVIANCMMMGQAVGTAAAIVSRGNDVANVKTIAIDELRSRLAEDGAIL